MKNDVKHALENAMTVGEVKRLLEDCPDDAAVFFSCDYGDYHNTEQALPVEEVLEFSSKLLYDSAYSKSQVAIRDDGGDDGEEDWYCEKCDEVYVIPTCPKCKTACVNEAGEKHDPNAESDAQRIVVLR